MIGLLQRVKQASVVVEDEIIAEIKTGLLVLVGVESEDTEQNAQRLFDKLISYRVFPDDAGKMNLGLKEIEGEILLVPQFTLAADTQKGLRPGFSSAAPPDIGKERFDFLIEYANKNFDSVKAGRFGADMQVNLINDGPVTFWLQTR